MSNVFLISDTHFSHANICTFYNSDGSKMRPWDNVTEMDEYIIEKWNKTVSSKDKIYHLGDVVIHKKALPIVSRLNGDKVLILGNHDVFPAKEYLKYFRDVRAYHRLDKLFLSHVPIHPESIKDKWVNVHGHTHCNNVRKWQSMFKETYIGISTPNYDKLQIETKRVIDDRYINVCVEQLDYTPISLEEIKKKCLSR